MTTPVTAQNPAMQGMSSQQGNTPGFPAPLGIEQYPGQQYLGQQYLGQQYPGQQYPGQQSSGQQNQLHQTVQQLVSQLLPIAQQVILPQVVATAVQQIQGYLHQIVTQQLTSQLTQQGGWQGSWQGGPQGSWQGGWQQPQFSQQGNTQFGRFHQGSF